MVAAKLTCNASFVAISKFLRNFFFAILPYWFRCFRRVCAHNCWRHVCCKHVVHLIIPLALAAGRCPPVTATDAINAPTIKRVNSGKLTRQAEEERKSRKRRNKSSDDECICKKSATPATAALHEINCLRTQLLAHACEPNDVLLILPHFMSSNRFTQAAVASYFLCFSIHLCYVYVTSSIERQHKRVLSFNFGYRLTLHKFTEGLLICNDCSLFAKKLGTNGFLVFIS